MKNLISLCLFGFLSTSCVVIKQQDEIMFYTEVEGGTLKMKQECNLINETGDITKILGQIKKDVRGVIQVLEGRVDSRTEVIIHEYAESIRTNTALVKQLSKEEWNRPDVPFGIIWRLSPSEFTKRQLAYDPKIKAVYFQGEERSDLLDHMIIEQNGNKFLIKFEQWGTMIEFCQLNETLMFVLEIQTGTPKNPKMKTFNLHVKLEN